MDDRDFVGYGRNPPDPQWPGKARVAVNFNLNFEAGGERTIQDGDGMSEGNLNDIGRPSMEGKRSPLVESVFEYGSRVGVWRLLRLFERYDVKVSVLAVAKALERSPEAARAFVELGHEIVSHHYRWIDYHFVDEATQREHVRLAMETIHRVTGSTPIGWMTGRSNIDTRRLLVEHGGIIYDRDALNDEIPYWVRVGAHNHLVIPYSYETNDNRFNENKGFSTSSQFAEYLIDTFNTFYDEGAEHPKLMSIGLHDRLSGRPGRSESLRRFLEHIRGRDRVWICTGQEIAEHWIKVHPACS
jgi:peptidoglycan/xylan/chitin deacetylase (PgdA/CDA1 family)